MLPGIIPRGYGLQFNVLCNLSTGYGSWMFVISIISSLLVGQIILNFHRFMITWEEDRRSALRVRGGDPRREGEHDETLGNGVAAPLSIINEEIDRSLDHIEGEDGDIVMNQTFEESLVESDMWYRPRIDSRLPLSRRDTENSFIAPSPASSVNTPSLTSPNRRYHTLSPSLFLFLTGI